MHRAVDKKTGAIRALDLPVVSKVEKDPGMAERPAAAIAGRDRLVNVDGFERAHMRLEMVWVLARTADDFTSMMIRFAARQSITPSRSQLRGRGIDDNP